MEKKLTGSLETMTLPELRERVVSLTQELKKTGKQLGQMQISLSVCRRRNDAYKRELETAKPRFQREYILSVLGEHGSAGYRTKTNSLDELGGEIARLCVGPEIAKVMRAAIKAGTGEALNLPNGLTQFFVRRTPVEDVVT